MVGLEISVHELPSAVEYFFPVFKSYAIDPAGAVIDELGTPETLNDSIYKDEWKRTICDI